MHFTFFLIILILLDIGLVITVMAITQAAAQGHDVQGGFCIAEARSFLDTHCSKDFCANSWQRLLRNRRVDQIMRLHHRAKHVYNDANYSAVLEAQN